MNRSDKVKLSETARDNLVDPQYDRAIGTVLAVSGQIATVRWDSNGRCADYSTAWLQKVEPEPAGGRRR